MLLPFTPTHWDVATSQCVRRQSWFTNCSSDHVTASFHALSLGNDHPETKIKSVNNLPGSCIWECRISKVQTSAPSASTHTHTPDRTLIFSACYHQEIPAGWKHTKLTGTWNDDCMILKPQKTTLCWAGNVSRTFQRYWSYCSCKKDHREKVCFKGKRSNAIGGNCWEESQGHR